MVPSRTLNTVYWGSVVGLLISGVVLPAIIGFLRTDYSIRANYISELGANGADYAAIINTFSFLPTALFSALAIACLALRPALTTMAQTGLILWIASLPLGYFTAFLFPCDYGCPLEGSAGQDLHNLAGLITYPTGIIGLIVLGIGLKRSNIPVAPRRAFGVAFILALCFVMMLLPENAPQRGLWQRFADYSMFALILSLGARIPKFRHPPDRA